MSKTTTCWVVKSPDGFYWDDCSCGWEMSRKDATRFETKKGALEVVESLRSSTGPYTVRLDPRVVRLVSKRDCVPSTILQAESALSDIADGINKLDDARTLLVASEKRLEHLVEFLKENS